MSPYIYDLEGWPDFRWRQDAIAALVATVRHRQGRLLGRMENLGFPLQQEASLETLTLEVVKSSEIEGEVLDASDVRSSLARRLGMDIGAMRPEDRHVEGVVEMMLDATQAFAAPLTRDRLFRWHAALFPTGLSAMRKIRVGAWRDDAESPMQVISGPAGKERVHFQAPAAPVVDSEMTRFLAWANTDDGSDAVLRAGVAHLWFVTVHPFDDGNGRMARAITDWLLARAENTGQRFYSMSAQIRHERSAYYDILEQTQKGTLDITGWLTWFLQCLNRAFDRTELTLAAVLRKARFWTRAATFSLNTRQRAVLNRLLDGFEGKLTTQKWAKLVKCSHDTALRDIQALMEMGLLRKESAGGRSTAYVLVEE